VRFLHIETARLEHQQGKKLQSEMQNFVQQNQVRFLGNIPSLYNSIVSIAMLFWCIAMGFVFWAENYHRNTYYPYNNLTMFSMIDSVFIATSSFTNSGLTSAPLVYATTGSKILIVVSMISCTSFMYELLMLFLYRRRLWQFIRQVFMLRCYLVV
jgi:hypothetical protein